MSKITNNISQQESFDAGKYNDKPVASKSESISNPKADLSHSGKDMQQVNNIIESAEAQKNSKYPTLPSPLSDTVLWKPVLEGLPSFGAIVLALIADTSAEGRRQSAMQRAMQTEIIIKEISEQAKIMLDKAYTQLVMGCVAGGLSIAQGVGSFGLMHFGMKNNAQLPLADQANANATLNTNVGAFNSSMGGINSILQSVSQSAGTSYDSRIKNKDAIIESARAMTDTLKNFEDSLRELITKAMAIQDAIQQNTNQTRTKILA